MPYTLQLLWQPAELLVQCGSWLRSETAAGGTQVATQGFTPPCGCCYSCGGGCSHCQVLPAEVVACMHQQPSGVHALRSVPSLSGAVLLRLQGGCQQGI